MPVKHPIYSVPMSWVLYPEDVTSLVKGTITQLRGGFAWQVNQSDLILDQGTCSYQSGDGVARHKTRERTFAKVRRIMRKAMKED